jgi:membrane peptidoglycan carboxypeptidase
VRGDDVVKRLTQFRSVLLAAPHRVASTSEPPTKSIRLKEVRRSSSFRLLSRVLPVFVVLVLVAIVVASPWIEAHVFAYAARRMTFHLVHEPGVPSASATAGPYDIRLGYAKLRSATENSQRAGFKIVAHAQSSWLESTAMKFGLPPIYVEKSQAGLEILDDRDQPMYRTLTPRRVYRDFASIPQLIVQSLLFAENREILDASTPYRNPTVEWDRLARAGIDFALHSVDRRHRVSGGSTVATQLEKLRHSARGQTASTGDKLRQMLSASLRAYQNGPQNLAARKQIVSDYINSLPLAAIARHGEVTGLADGLQAWFGADVDDLNRLLDLSDDAAESTGRMHEKALAYREALSLLLAAKKPSTYLASGAQTALTHRVDAYLRLLAKSGVISGTLRDAALDTKLPSRTIQKHQLSTSDFAGRKGIDAVRAGLLPLLGVQDLYDLDRFDLAVQATLDQPVTEAVGRTLQSVSNAVPATEPRLFGKHLLNPATGGGVVYSFMLYERSNGVNLLRVQADSYKQPLNINQGTKLELGSTAKLRTLACYLELVSELHSRLAGKIAEELRGISIDAEDALSDWAVRYLTSTSDRSLPAMLEAAMNRSYSANPGETFFTGGGVHHFANFEREDSGRIVTVREAFQRSVNLAFIRLMRDIVHYRMVQNVDSRTVLDSNVLSSLRRRYLERFADMEGQEFLGQFYRKYESHRKSALTTLLSARPLTPSRFAAIYRYVRPEAGLQEFEQFAMSCSLPVRTDEMVSLYTRFGPEKFSLNDQGYLVRVHPLELWVVAYLVRHPEASLSEVLSASAPARQEAYSWLFKGSRKRAQDVRIRILLERDAFKEIHRSWAALGFPFRHLVPSFATAIGSSGDNPEALATLAGIILNGGIRYRSIQIRRLNFAEGTPMETVLEYAPAKGQRVMSEAVAAVLQRELIGVVDHGTGLRAHGSVVLNGGRIIPVGGKTGTGDNRVEQFGPHGAVFGSKVRNRTAAFVFTIGDRFFGTVLAYAHGPDAVTQSFTSSLAVQVFRELIPSLRSMLARGFENHVSCIGPTGPLARRGLIALAVPAEDIQSSDRPPTGR